MHFDYLSIIYFNCDILLRTQEIKPNKEFKMRFVDMIRMIRVEKKNVLWRSLNFAIVSFTQIDHFAKIHMEKSMACHRAHEHADVQAHQMKTKIENQKHELRIECIALAADEFIDLFNYIDIYIYIFNRWIIFLRHNHNISSHYANNCFDTYSHTQISIFKYLLTVYM